MAKKEKDAVLDKKTKEQFTQEVMEEINTKYKDDICSSIVDDVKKSFDHDYKENIKKQISDELINDIKKDIAKEQKKLMRSRNFKIFRLYIYVLALIAVSGYMIYCLYVSDNIELLKNRGVTSPTTKIEMPITTTTTVAKDLSWYIKEYGNLLDNVRIADYSLFAGNINILSLPIEKRLALAYQVIDKTHINVDGIINSIDEKDVLDAYNKVFGTNDGYTATNFNAEGLSYAYSTNGKTFIAISSGTNESVVASNKIIDIKENNDTLIITAIVGVIKDGKVYNVEDMNEPVGDSNDLSLYADSLIKVDYTFKKINNDYYIDSIVKR